MAKVDIEIEVSQRKSDFICCCCGKVLKTSSFYSSNSKSSITRIDKKGISRMIICKTCAQEIFNFLLKINKNRKNTLLAFCAAFDIYYDEEIADRIERDNTDDYLNTYMDFLKNSPTIKERSFIDSYNEKIPEASSDKKQEEGELNPEDEANLREIYSTFHYDPFEKEPLLEPKKLYRDLVTMIDPAMVDDLVRQRAAIEIVRSFARIDKWTETINELSKDPQTMAKKSKEIKTLIETKNKETDMVTKFSKDHGFAERYANAKSRGTGTLSAAIRDMEEFDFDDGKVNLYDIETSKSMQQAADISTAAIMKQLNLSEADYIVMLKTQRERMVQLQTELDRTREELRLVYSSVTKQEILKELATSLLQKGMKEDEVYKAILSEINFDENKLKNAQKLSLFLKADSSSKKKRGEDKR